MGRHGDGKPGRQKEETRARRGGAITRRGYHPGGITGAFRSTAVHEWREVEDGIKHMLHFFLLWGEGGERWRGSRDMETEREGGALGTRGLCREFPLGPSWCKDFHTLNVGTTRSLAYADKAGKERGEERERGDDGEGTERGMEDRKSTRLNSSHRL